MSSRRVTVAALLGALTVACLATRVASAEELDGATLYRQKCARCHGKTGEGTKVYRQALTGKRSVAQLARYIAKEMPEDDPGTCTGPQAEKVAAYIFDAFYSPAAQARLKKAPRVELARLTVNEYRNAVADLVGPFRTANARPGKDEQGLRGAYFTNVNRRRRKPVFTRIDPRVNFDLGASSPDYAKFKTGEISVNWQGSVIAPETGLYDFVVRTEHSTRLWVNDMKRPLIDAGVKSGNETEFRGSLYLLAGRAYPLRLEFFTTTLGVRKDQKDKKPPPKITIALAWKTPVGPVEVIPQRNLRTADAPTTFALSVPMPADDRNAGYERGTAVSRAWVQATTDGAIETANYIAAHLADLSGVRNDAPKRKALLRDYCTAFAQRAFRRPLTPEQKRLYVDRQFEVAKDPETAVKRVVLLVLQSPRFLYREPGRAGDAFDVAARLSFALWDSLPDQELLRAATAGRLKTRDDVAREAKRMLADPRARTKLRAFFLQWLKLDQVTELQKDRKLFPKFDATVAAELRTSLDLFLEDVLWSKSSDFRQLLLADHLYLNGRLAQLYGGGLPEKAPFRKVVLKSGERAGVLTHPLVLAHLAYTATSSPIHRGVFVARNLLGVSLRPPPDAFTPLAPDLHPKLNTRERITLQTSPKACVSCHGVINPLGFTLENYDAIGRFREREKGRPIDASGFFVTASGQTKKFKGVRDLARFLVNSKDAQETFVARMFHHLVRQPVEAFGPHELDKLRRRFAENNYNMQGLIVEIAALAALPDRQPQPTTAGARRP